jgi:hypothetical protein
MSRYRSHSPIRVVTKEGARERERWRKIVYDTEHDLPFICKHFPSYEFIISSHVAKKNNTNIAAGTP